MLDPLPISLQLKYGHPPGALRVPCEPLDATTVVEAVSVICCWYKDKTKWSDGVGWIYRSVLEDVVQGIGCITAGGAPSCTA